jgi:hypothetical protein
VAVGDIFNKQKNSLVIVTTDGWCYIYETVDNHSKQTEETEKTDEELSQVWHFVKFNVFVVKVIYL